MSNLEKDLAEVVEYLSGPFSANFSEHFIRTHHAEIAQNAEDARRLKALEQVMDEARARPHSMFATYEGGWTDALFLLKERADEIMRAEPVSPVAE